jgi:DNA primase
VLNGNWEGKLQSPHLHMPGPISFVYNMELLEKSKNKKIFIAEGCIDTLTLLSHGRPAVGLFGASRMNDTIASLFVDRTPYFILDCDMNGAGQEAAVRNAGILLRNGIKSKICFLPETGKSYDINEYMLNHTDDDLKYVIKNSVPFEKTMSFLQKKYIRKNVISHNDCKITDVIDHYGLKRIRNEKGYKISCPIPAHKDSQASMQIYLATNSFFCFGAGCNKAGDGIDLIRFIENVPRQDAEKIYSQFNTDYATKSNDMAR